MRKINVNLFLFELSLIKLEPKVFKAIKARAEETEKEFLSRREFNDVIGVPVMTKLWKASFTRVRVA